MLGEQHTKYHNIFFNYNFLSELRKTKDINCCLSIKSKLQKENGEVCKLYFLFSRNNIDTFKIYWVCVVNSIISETKMVYGE